MSILSKVIQFGYARMEENVKGMYDIKMDVNETCDRIIRSVGIRDADIKTGK